MAQPSFNTKINFGYIGPSFMIIGAQKAGTSSLYHYLSQHPQIVAPKIKELHYFDTKQPTPAGPYVKNFPSSYLTRLISFEATPRYLYFPGTAKKIYEFNPRMKFIVVLRDPAKRAYSAWNMYREMSKNLKQVNRSKEHEHKHPDERLYHYLYAREFPVFEDWITLERGSDFPSDVLEPSIVRRGYYKEQIATYLAYFPLSSFLFLDFDDFKTNIFTTLQKVTGFAGVEDFSLQRLDLAPKNKRVYNTPISEGTYRTLSKHYQEMNKGLEQIVNLELNWM